MKRKSGVSQISKPFACLLGAGVCLCVMTAVAVVGTICIQNEYLKITSVGWIACVAHILGAGSGAMFTGKLVSEQKALMSGLSCIGYMVLLACSAMLFFGGISGTVMYCVVGCAVGYFASLLPMLTGKKRSVSRRRRSFSG